MDFLGDHQRERLARFPESSLELRSVDQPAGDVDVFAVRTMAVVMDLARVHRHTKPESQVRLLVRVPRQQNRQSGNDRREQHGLRCLIYRPDQAQRAVATVDEGVAGFPA